MPNRNYERGRRFEYGVQQEALKHGALLSFRTAGSHGDYDIISIYPPGTQHQIFGVVELVQCKTKIVSKSKLELVSEAVVFEGTYYVRGVKRTKFITKRNNG